MKTDLDFLAKIGGNGQFESKYLQFFQLLSPLDKKYWLKKFFSIMHTHLLIELNCFNQAMLLMECTITGCI